jgi:hypothetical protein
MPITEPRFLCILAIPRTGTNYLCALLSGIAGIRSRTEIFHDAEAFGLTAGEIEAVGAAAQQAFRGRDDPNLRTWMRHHPAAAVRAIFRAPGQPAAEMLSFKVFPGQLPINRISGRLIPMPRMRFLIVKRRIIDAYVSQLKAQQIGRWADADTTDIRVVLDPAQFIRYVERNRRWYRTLSGELARAGKPHEELIYEEFAAQGDRKLTEDLVTRLHGLGFRGMAPGSPQAKPRKQDRSPTYHEKVANWVEFAEDPRVRRMDIDMFGYF